jgi:hypothetical protein
LIGFGAAGLAAAFGADFFAAVFFFAICVLWYSMDGMGCRFFPFGKRNVGHARAAAKP